MERARSDLRARVLQCSLDESRPHLCADRVNARCPLHRSAWAAGIASECRELPGHDSTLRHERAIPSALLMRASRASPNKDQALDTPYPLSCEKRRSRREVQSTAYDATSDVTVIRSVDETGSASSGRAPD